MTEGGAWQTVVNSGPFVIVGDLPVQRRRPKNQKRRTSVFIVGLHFGKTSVLQKVQSFVRCAHSLGPPISLMGTDQYERFKNLPPEVPVIFERVADEFVVRRPLVVPLITRQVTTPQL